MIKIKILVSTLVLEFWMFSVVYFYCIRQKGMIHKLILHLH